VNEGDTARNPLQDSPTKHAIEIVRANNDSSPQHDDYGVLVHRLGPRGQTKATVDYDEWTGDAAPNAGNPNFPDTIPALRSLWANEWRELRAARQDPPGDAQRRFASSSAPRSGCERGLAFSATTLAPLASSDWRSVASVARGLKP